MRSAFTIILLITASRFVLCDQPAEFRLCEWRRPAGLSAQYRVLLDEAIEAYRRDCVESGTGVFCTALVYSGDTPVLPGDAALQNLPAFVAEVPFTLRSTTRPEDFDFIRQ